MVNLTEIHTQTLTVISSSQANPRTNQPNIHLGQTRDIRQETAHLQRSVLFRLLRPLCTCCHNCPQKSTFRISVRNIMSLSQEIAVELYSFGRATNTRDDSRKKHSGPVKKHESLSMHGLPSTGRHFFNPYPANVENMVSS